MSTKSKCIIYIRVSDPSQVDGTGLDEQLDRCREYAEREGWQVVRVFREEGVSAKMMERPEFTKALGYLMDQKGKVQYFVMHKLDRISRNTEDQLPIMQALRHAGAELKSASETLENTPAGRFMRNVLWATANFDNEVRAERCHAGCLRRFKEGYWVHTPRPGYAMKRNENIKRVESIPNQFAPHVIKAFERRAEGWSYEEIANEMNKNKYRTRTGKKIGTSNVEIILKNPFYYGLMKAFGLEAWGKHKPLISQQLWYKAQAVTKERSRNSSSKTITHPLYPLRVFVYCKKCGHNLTGSAPRGRGDHYPYYHHGKHKCEVARYVPKDELEPLFRNHLSKFKPRSERFELLKAVILEVWQEKVKTHKKEQDQSHLLLSDLLTQKENLLELKRTKPHLYTDEEFLQQKHELDNQINQVRGERVEDEEIDRRFDQAVELAYSLLADPVLSWDELFIQPKVRFQRVLFPERLAFDGKTFGTAEISLNLELLQLVSERRSNLVGPAGFEPATSEV